MIQRLLLNWYKVRKELKLSGGYCVLLPSPFSSTFSLERPCHLHGTLSSSVPALSWKRQFFSLYSMLCLLVLFHCFALKLCVLYAQFITPVICCPDWHQPGNITWKFIAQRNHHPFFSPVVCNRRYSLRKRQPFSSQVFSCSAAITYCQLFLSKFWNVTGHMLDT